MLDLKQRINCFQIVLYGEKESNLNYFKIKEIIDSASFYSNKNYSICHNKDIIENGDLKKEHFHLVVKLDNAVSIENIVKALSNEREIQEAIAMQLTIVKSVKGAIQYLIHLNHKNKYQYDINEIVSNDSDLLLYFKEENTLNEFEKIIRLIDVFKIKTLRELISNAINRSDVLLLDYIKNNTYLVNSIIRG